MLPPTLEPKEPTLKEPGVYVRSAIPDHELDVLWDRERKKHHDEHERSHLGFFAAGFAVGVLVTLAGGFLFYANPGLSLQTKPAIIQEEMLPPKEELQQPAAVAPVAPVEAEKTTAPAAEKPASTGLSLPFFSAQPKPEPKPTPEIKAESYEVKDGDTLGSIAIKFYHSSGPEYVEKIKRANKMSDADSLSLGQKLSIPPKSY